MAGDKLLSIVVHPIIKYLNGRRAISLEQRWTKTAKIAVFTGLLGLGYFLFTKIRFSSDTKDGLDPTENLDKTSGLCKAIITASNLEFENSGYCTYEEIEKAKAEHIRLREEVFKQTALAWERARQLKEGTERRQFPCEPIITESGIEFKGTCSHEQIDNALEAAFKQEELKLAKEKHSKKEADRVRFPCKPIVNRSELSFENEKYCSMEEIIQAKNEYIRLRAEEYAKKKAIEEEHDRQIKEEAIKMGQDRAKAYMEKAEQERAKIAEFIRILDNPTAEEKRQQQQWAYAKMDQQYPGWRNFVGDTGDAPEVVQPECPENSRIDKWETHLHLPDSKRIQWALDSKINAFCKQHAEIILGVNSEASQQEIKKRFRQLSASYHPDKNPSESALKAFYLISIAHETLTNQG